MYEVQATPIIEALVEMQTKVKKKALGKRLAEVEAKALVAKMLVAVEVDILSDKMSVVKTKAHVGRV